MSEMNLESMSPEQMQEMAELLEAKIKQEKQDREEVLAHIAHEKSRKFESLMATRGPKHAQMLEALKLYLGPLATRFYTENMLFKEKETEDRRPEHNIVLNKCQVAISQTIAYQFAAGDKNWSIRAPAKATLDEVDRQQIAELTGNAQMTDGEILEYRAMLMEKQVEAHLANTRYAAESRKAMQDRVILGSGIMKGPMNAGKLKKIYERAFTSEGKPIRIPRYIREDVPLGYRVKPWYFFPDDSVNEIEKAEFTIEVHPFSRSELRELLKHPGYMPDQIQLILEDEGPCNYANNLFTDPAFVTQGINTLNNKYLALEYHGPIKKSDLTKMGMDTKEDQEEFYADIWICNNRVIRLEIEEAGGCYRVPYCVSVWEPDPASILGFGIPMLARDQQRVVNETFAMMLDNAGLSAGPQIVVDTTLVKPANGEMECTPFAVWYVNGDYGMNDTSKAIQFFTPPNSYEGLSQVFMMSKGLADEECSVPNFMATAQTPTGAADSATGQALYQQNATSPLFYKSEGWDDDITAPYISMFIDWEMQYNPDDSIKGAYELDVRTSTSQLRNAIEQQELSGLSQEVAQGGPMAEWIKMDGLALARLARSRLPGKDIVKSPEEVARERAAAPPPPPDPNLLKAQADMMNAETEQKKLELENRRLDFEMNQKAEEARMKYEAQMRTDITREKEAQASVIKAQLDYQGRMAELAARSEHDRSKIIADLQKSQMSIEADKFLQGTKIPIEIGKQDIQREELKIKKAQGSGVTGVR